ncbi:MAG TPA: hypothetical protein VNW29_03000 [Candidatus Sulfotelmatobacter sp.]|jgi:hypothetical protein|nr:hypothetical protein [Candidatus Sulfotelmatobacter sp.]
MILKNNYYSLLCIFFLFLMASLLFPKGITAQTTKNLISVTPSLIHLDLQTDAPETELVYTNDTNQTILLTLSAADFTELEDGYTLSYLEGRNAKNYRYRLSEWITFEKQILTISPHKAESVKVFINKKHLTPGGHYATILARLISKKDNKNIQLQGVLSSLLFIRTNTGQENEEALIQRFFPVQEWFAFPKTFLLRFQNTGNSELTPYGSVTIKDFFGFTIAKGTLNESSAMTLPESIRQYDISIRKTSNILLPGMYTATLSLHFGKTQKQRTQSVQFFSEGIFPVITVSGILFIVVFLFSLYTKIKKSKRE